MLHKTSKVELQSISKVVLILSSILIFLKRDKKNMRHTYPLMYFNLYAITVLTSSIQVTLKSLTCEILCSRMIFSLLIQYTYIVLTRIFLRLCSALRHVLTYIWLQNLPFAIRPKTGHRRNLLYEICCYTYHMHDIVALLISNTIALL